MTARHLRFLIAALALAVVAAVPVFAGTGGGKENAPGQQKEKTPKVAITLTGTVEKAAGEGGKQEYTLTDGGKTYTLSAGPKWFFAEDSYPLDPFVGDSVTIEGEVEEGGTDVDVISVNGTALRGDGKPPWAGGWKAVGEKHPGWSQDKADRFKEKFGDCFPPGQCKDKPNEGADPESPEGQ